MDDVNLFALYNTKTDLSEERRKEGKICKNVLYNFHCSFKGNNKNFRFMSPLSMFSSVYFERNNQPLSSNIICLNCTLHTTKCIVKTGFLIYHLNHFLFKLTLSVYFTVWKVHLKITYLSKFVLH